MPARSRFRTALRRKSCGMRPGHSGLPTRRPPHLAEVRASVPLVPVPGQVQEEPPLDASHLPLQRRHALHLSREQALELWRQIHEAAVVVLCRARLEAQRPRLEVELAPRRCEHLARHPPAVGIGDRHDGLEVGRQSTAHRLKLRALEEPLARRRLLEASILGGRCSLLCSTASLSILPGTASSRLMLPFEPARPDGARRSARSPRARCAPAASR